MTWIGRSKGTVTGAIAGLLVLSAAHSAGAQAPKADRPTYAVGDKWIRRDGAYDLIRIENGRYIFAADGGREVHLTRDLGVAKIVRGGQVLLELEPPPGLTWPLEVGESGVSCLTLNSIAPQFGQSVARLTWKVDASQDVRVPAGVFKAFRIAQVLEPRFLAASPQSRRLELAFWYAPAIQQLVRADGNDLSGPAFQAVALHRPVAAAPAGGRPRPQDPGRGAPAPGPPAPGAAAGPGAGAGHPAGRGPARAARAGPSGGRAPARSDSAPGGRGACAARRRAAIGRRSRAPRVIGETAGRVPDHDLDTREPGARGPGDGHVRRRGVRRHRRAPGPRHRQRGGALAAGQSYPAAVHGGQPPGQ